MRPAHKLRFQYHDNPMSLRIQIAGEVRFPREEDFHDRIRLAFSVWPGDVELDLTDCIFINEKGYEPILELMARARVFGRDFVVTNAETYIKKKLLQMGAAEYITEWRTGAWGGRIFMFG